MKSIFNRSPNLFIAIVLLMLSCNKPKDSSNDAGSFTWTWNSTTYTANFKEAFTQSLSVNPIIIAGTGTTLPNTGSGPRISLNSLNVGTYTLGTGIVNGIQFVSPNGDGLHSSSGTLNITLNANNKLSGYFSATLIDATNVSSTLTGSFNKITISF